MEATDVKIAGICTESRTASNGTSPGVQNPKKITKQIQKISRFCFCLFEQSWVFADGRTRGGQAACGGRYVKYSLSPKSEACVWLDISDRGNIGNTQEICAIFPGLVGKTG